MHPKALFKSNKAHEFLLPCMTSVKIPPSRAILTQTCQKIHAVITRCYMFLIYNAMIIDIIIVTRSGCWGFLLRLLPITETTLEYSLGPFILPRKPSLHVQAI